MIEYYKNLSLEPLFYANEFGLVCQEQWKDIPDYVGYYQASDLGRIKTLNRVFINHLNLKIVIKEKILIQNTSKRYLSISLCKDGCQKTTDVHKIIFFTFNGHYPKKGSGFKIDHHDNISFNNVLTNLKMITNRKNLTKDKILNNKYLGVWISGNKFRTSIEFEGKSRELGTFNTEKEAHEKYMLAFNLLEKGMSIEHLIKRHKTASSGQKHIYFENNKYRVRKKINKKSKSFGSYDTLEEAIVIRDKILSKEI